MDPRIRPWIETLWNYHRLDHQLSHADAIVVPCSHDVRVAERAAELYAEGWAPLVVFSGGLGAITRYMWQEPEADRFANIAVQMSVPKDRILVENKSTNTGENVRFTRQLLAANGIPVRKLIVVQKPYMERRSYATFKQMWPDIELVVTSAQVSLDEYLSSYSNDALSVHDVISIIVGDLQRIRVYAERGFQIPQPIPDDVWHAFEKLVEAGYDARLVRT
jgi:uncharacterized SAM-binding protein YcdF (DUF218 family)